MNDAAPISIVIPAHNQLDYCRLCIQSIQRNTERACQLILINNGSTDGVAEYFDSIPGAMAIHSKENLGFAAGVNLGLREAAGHVLILNSDTIVTPGWLNRLERALLSSPEMGMIGPVSNYTSGPQLIPDLTLETTDAIDAYAGQRALERLGEVTPCERLVAFCVLIRDVVLKTVGLFDERFGIGNFEDDDYCHRAIAAGYTLGIAQDCFIFHFGHRTFVGMGYDDAAWSELLKENEQRFVEKWRVKPELRAGPAKRALELNASAMIDHKEGRHKQALAKLVEAVQLYPLAAECHNNLGAVLWNLGEHERAYDAFARAVRAQPDYEQARANLLDAARALGREKPAEQLLHHHAELKGNHGG